MVTGRLVLRRPSPADVDAIFRIHRDPAACAHNPDDMLATWAEAEERYGLWDAHWRRHGFGYWVVRRRADELWAVGFCGLKVMWLAGREVLNLFYRLEPAAWGAGVATEAATAVVGWAAVGAPGRPVVARVRPLNVASAAVAERAGLVRDERLDVEGADGLDHVFVRGW